MIGAYGLWGGRDLYPAIPTMTRDLCRSHKQNTTFSRLKLRQAGGT